MTKINGQEWIKYFLSGANNLINNKAKIDALNVFPVPDGDTGTNMASTIGAAAEGLVGNSDDNLATVSAFIAKKMLYDARGNSGVILSQIFKGFALAFENKKEVNSLELVSAFAQASKKAYSSVIKPVEGTILTVIRETFEALEKQVNSETTFEEFFEIADKYSRISCNNTPNKLKVLREVGVNDSGGEGLQCIIAGMLSYAKGNPIEISKEQEAVTEFISNNEVYDGEFGYCTEFIVDLREPENFDKKAFEAVLAKKGITSLVLVNDGNILKVHGHTIRPGEMLTIAQKHGEFIKIKSENMSLQAEDAKKKTVEEGSKEQPSTNGAKPKKCGIVSCNLGNGFIQLMNELGCDQIIVSGQTQNPSANEIINAIKLVNAKNVFVLPNNKNVFMAAKQASQVIKDKKIYVIESRSQVEGINAIFSFDPDASAKDNVDTLREAIKMVDTGEITRAVRDTKIGGVKIKQNDYIGIFNGVIKNSNDNLIDATKELIDWTLTEDEKEVITIYYGNESSENEATLIKNYVESTYDVEVDIKAGEQPNYNFIISFE
ncbi:DAK2 domain-containing protein [Mycoplasmopsis opalescens]|uniref:DAK2 domain-containing protein n=1 Tax=Mycoplasmopsis opalescens TaxID=114886 RepID=UPI0004A75842|nr:DAK2 domain-containing protein [Mycoplasmopsis opalescens]